MSKRSSYSSSLELSSLDLLENTEPAGKRRRKSQSEIIPADPSAPIKDSPTTIMETLNDVKKIINLKSPKASDLMEKNNLSTEQKQVRYDRQLRLWGDHGQALLEKAHICLLNATAVGAETLKSLVLSGVGAFTVIDGNLVTGMDVGANFFLENSAIGQARAKVAFELLQELNPDVRGNYVASSADSYISQHGLSVFDQFTAVIAANLSRKVISPLSEYLFSRGIPLVICHVNGLVGYVQLSVKEHPIIESHPENPLPNFMLDKPFPELINLVSSIDLDSLNHKDHSHTPYLILLFKALDIWRMRKDDPAAFPQNYKEKKELKSILLSMRKPDEKGSLDEENFAEAINAVNTAFVEAAVPQNVRAIVDAAVENEFSSNFWILCSALKRFITEYGRLPVSGILPDMISDSARYVQLQNVFKRKAEEEAAIIHAYALEGSRNRTVPASDVRLLCKNAAHLRLIKSTGPPRPDQIDGDRFAAALRNEDSMNALWYLIMYEAERFFDDHGRYPGSNHEEDVFQKDKNELLDRVVVRVRKLLGDGEKPDKLAEMVEEVCRYGGSELHTIASFFGGVAAHEVIKLVTYQYVPANNTYIFDGNTGRGSVSCI